MNDLKNYVRKRAVALGADGVSVIPASDIVVDQRFADMCSSGYCSGYGISPTCPPYSMKPSEFRELLEQFRYALVFKVTVPVGVLTGEERHSAAKPVHLISSSLEKELRAEGLSAAGFATGSCRLVLCENYSNCPVLDGSGCCRFPGVPRPSLSGLGVDFTKLFELLGWALEVIAGDTSESETGSLAGMVLFQKKR
ncbi:hypothetical protein CSA37_03910 [Candidatus Fermentibacteria bacterium]|nr:MAG: hypothetical protein CSA37_03910 [Candidatus Fermentibacteria bacterium]